MPAGFAFFRVQTGIVQRSAGGSACRRAAYQAGEQLDDPRTGETFDYSHKTPEVIASRILTPKGADNWASDRAQLWPRAEMSEKRKDAQTGRTLDFSIPRDLPQAEWQPFAEHMLAPYVRDGMIVDYAVHSELASDGQAQPHVSALMTMRRLDPAGPKGFSAKKATDWNDIFADFRKKAGIKGLPQAEAMKTWRQAFEDRANDFLDQPRPTMKTGIRVTLASNDHLGLPAPEPILPKAEFKKAKRLGRDTAAIVVIKEYRQDAHQVKAALAEIDKSEPKPPAQVIDLQQRHRDLEAEAQEFIGYARDQVARHTANVNAIRVPPKAGLRVRQAHEIKRDWQQQITNRKTIVAGTVARLVEQRDRPWTFTDHFRPSKWAEQFRLNAQIAEAERNQTQVDGWAAERTTWLDSDAGRNAIAEQQTNESRAARKADQPHHQAQAEQQPHVEAARRVAVIAHDATALLSLAQNAASSPDAKEQARLLLEKVVAHPPHAVPEELRQQLRRQAAKVDDDGASIAHMERIHEINAAEAIRARLAGPPAPAPSL